MLGIRMRGITPKRAAAACFLSPLLPSPFRICSSFFSTASLTLTLAQARLSRIRNIGIIAHIDAGKTTTTERCLFYAQKIRHMGDVDHGDTTMDFMREERERGITIQAACITFFWNSTTSAAAATSKAKKDVNPKTDTRINLIDTPGHVDFTQQVEQSLRVLDGAVCVLDGVKGVEAQTVCVWNQAAKYGVARMVFVNKLDRDGANFKRAVESVRNKLDTTPLVLTLPLYDGSAKGGDGTREAFVGLIDVVRMETWEWRGGEGGDAAAIAGSAADPGLNYITKPLDPMHSSYKEAMAAREELLEILSENDDVFMTQYMDVVGEKDGHLKLKPEQIINTLRNIVTANNPTAASTAPGLATVISPQKYTLVLCGSSKANKGVQFLLNSIVDYLPSPLDKQHVEIEEVKAAAAADKKGNKGQSKKNASVSSAANVDAAASSTILRPVGNDPNKEGTLALAFKVTHDLERGAMPIVFVRVYTGAIKKGEAIVSVSPPQSSDASAPSASPPHSSGKDSSPAVQLSSSALTLNALPTLPKERPQKLLEISADNLSLELNTIEAGNIGALVGLKGARTGDTILSANVASAALSSKEKIGYLKGMTFSEPVFFCSVEASSLTAANALEQALACLQREDPSLQVSQDKESGQTILKGMGELHLEIVRSRLEHDFLLGEAEGGGGIEFGKMKISYREGIGCQVSQTDFKHVSAGADAIETQCSVELEPLEPGQGVEVNIDAPASLQTASPAAALMLELAEAGVKDGLARGPLLGYPLTDVRVNVTNMSWGTFAVSNILAQTFRACASRAVSSALRQAKADGACHLLEPVMSAGVTTNASHVGDVLSDLTAKRRASITDVVQLAEGKVNRSEIAAEVPLACMLGYASVLRSTTQGNGSFSMQFKEFRAVPSHVQNQLLESPP